MITPFRQPDLRDLPGRGPARRGDGALSRKPCATSPRWPGNWPPSLLGRDSGVISFGKVWRGHRLSCPSRQELGGFLLGVLPDDAAQYVTFHLEVVGCRCCQANVADLRTSGRGPSRY